MCDVCCHEVESYDPVPLSVGVQQGIQTLVNPWEEGDIGLYNILELKILKGKVVCSKIP